MAYEQALATAFAAPAVAVAEPPARWARTAIEASEDIVIHHAREHNLKNVDVRIPRDRFTVITGVSGSGKSTLAFDILFNEGQRRYLESLNAYARQFVQPASRPDVDAIFGIPPTVAIEQRTSRGGRKSTVATLTEIYHFLRLLYVKLGTQYCPDCDLPIEPQSPAAIGARLLRDYRGRTVTLLAPLVVARKGFYTDLAKWAAKKGYRELQVDGVNIPTGRWPRLNRFKEHTIELPVATLDINAKKDFELQQALGKALDYGKGLVSVMPAGQSQAAMFSTAARLSVLWPQFRGTGSAHVLLQFETRLVHELLWHRAYDSRIRRGPNGRRDLVERVVRTGSRFPAPSAMGSA